MVGYYEVGNIKNEWNYINYKYKISDKYFADS